MRVNELAKQNLKFVPTVNKLFMRPYAEFKCRTRVGSECQLYKIQLRASYFKGPQWGHLTKKKKLMHFQVIKITVQNNGNY